MAEPDGDRVQLLTVHAAKGLEWDVGRRRRADARRVPGRGPAGRRLEQAGRGAAVPAARRPRRAAGAAAGGRRPTRRHAHDAARRPSATACRERGALEERRLAYVAVTRARDAAALLGLLVGHGARSRAGRRAAASDPRAVPGRWRRVDVWAERADRRRRQPAGRRAACRAQWPVDPLGGRRTSRRGRRPPWSALAAATVAGAGRPRPAPRRRWRPGTPSSSCCWPSWPASAAPPGRRRRAAGPAVGVAAGRAATRPGRAGPVAAPAAAAQAGAAGPPGHRVPPLAGEPGRGSSGCSTSTSCPAPPTRRPSPTTTCSRCRRRSARASGRRGCRPRSSCRSTGRRRHGAPRPLRRGLHRRTRRHASTSSTGRPGRPDRRRGRGRRGAARGLPAGLAPPDRRRRCEHVRAAFHYVARERHGASRRPARRATALVELIRSVPAA